MLCLCDSRYEGTLKLERKSHECCRNSPLKPTKLKHKQSCDASVSSNACRCWSLMSCVIDKLQRLISRSSWFQKRSFASSDVRKHDDGWWAQQFLCFCISVTNIVRITEAVEMSHYSDDDDNYSFFLMCQVISCDDYTQEADTNVGQCCLWHSLKNSINKN